MIPHYIIRRTRIINDNAVIDYLSDFKGTYIYFSPFKSDAYIYDNVDDAIKQRNSLNSMHTKDLDIHKFKVTTL